MPNPAFGFKDYDEMFVKRAASGGCGSEERAREAARAKEITGINSQNDVNQMIDWCRQEEEKKANAAMLSNMPAGPSGPANTAGGSLTDNEGIFGRGLTPAEFDFVTGQENAKLDAALEENRLETIGNFQLANQTLLNDASKYAIDGSIARSQIEQDGANFRTRYTADTSLDLQRIRNAGATEVAQIERDAAVFGSLINSFNF
jgi:hypothetical protein